MKNFINRLMERLENSPLAPFMQFIRFGLVGFTSTLVSYGIEMLMYYVVFRDTVFSALEPVPGLRLSADQVRVMAVNIVAFVISVTYSYMMNSRFTFRSEEKRTFGQHLRSYLKTVASYAFTGLLLAPAIKMGLSGMGVPYYAASLLSLLVTIPLNYVLNKFWAFRQTGSGA